MSLQGMSLPLSTGLVLKTEPASAVSNGPIRVLTAAIKAGDEQAFTRFYDLYSLRLYKHALVLSKGNEPEAREVVQSVVLRLASRFQVFDDERRLWGWLCRCVHNAYLDLYRARQRRDRTVSLDALQIEIMQEGADQHRWSDALRFALAELEPAEQELLHAAYVDERPLKDLAENGGDSYKAVESRLGRLRQKVKTRLLGYLRREK